MNGHGARGGNEMTMQRRMCLLMLAGVVGFSWPAASHLGAVPQTSATITYTASAEDFANPERGFFVQRSYNPARAKRILEDARTKMK